MPELPEVEVVRRGLRERIIGRQITGVEVHRDRATRRHQRPEELAERLVGRTVEEVARRGKFLVLDLDGPDAVVAHLGMSGRLLLGPADEATAGTGATAARHAAVTMELSPDLALRFVDPRTFGQVFVVPAGPPGQLPPVLGHLGPDALESRWSPARLAQVLGSRRYRVKPLLLDQTVIAGIGNIYADEILFAARVRFDRPGTTLRPAELRRLAGAIPDVLEEAIELRGSSLADGQYVDLMGSPGSYQLRHQVYGREGQPCRRCAGREVVRRSRIVGRSTFFCPRCQR